MQSRFARVIDLVCVAAAFGYAAVYVYVSTQRIGYPFELEWMEGGSLEHVLRVLRGEPLFVTPSIEFVPFPYPPFYYYLAAGLARLTGANFFTLRLISFASSLGTAWLIYRFATRESRRAVLGIVCAGIFLATWRVSGLYFDVARLDSLFVFLLMLSLYTLRFSRTRWQLLLAAASSFLAVMTKQTGAVVVAPVALWCLWEDWRTTGRDLSRWREWRRFAGYGLPVAALVGAGTFLLNGVIDEHFLRHVVNAQQSHGIRSEMIRWFFLRDLLLPLPVVCGLLVLWLGAWSYFRSSGAEPAPAGAPAESAAGAPRWDVFYVVVLVAVAVACLVPRIKVSGAANNLIPVHAWLAVSFALAATRLGALLPRAKARFALAVSLGSLLQLGVLFYVPRGFVPTAADREAGARLVRRLAAVEGEVLVPSQGYLAGLAGKRVYAHQMPVSDYAKSGLSEAAPLASSYARAIREKRFAMIIDSNTQFVAGYPERGLLARHYRMVGWALPDPAVFLPISGPPIRPGKIWLPDTAARGGPGP